ncbi:MAG: phosphotyrosine protein phosphatase [Bacteroidota bacterium]
MNPQVLFICSRNQWRSRTAEEIFKNHPEVAVRSAGTSSTARIRVNAKLLEWADTVFVMERAHKKILQARFPEILTEKEVLVLDIPDEYAFMDPELVEMLEGVMEEYLS